MIVAISNNQCPQSLYLWNKIRIMSLKTSIEKYIETGYFGKLHFIWEDFCIVENPTFAIIPNHPYRSPFVAAIYCSNGHGQGRVNAKTYQITSGGFFIVLPGQITELVDVSDDFNATYILMDEHFTNSLSIGNTFNIRNIILDSPYTQLDKQSQEALTGYLKMCQNLADTEKNPHRIEILQLLTRAYFLGLGYFIHQQNETYLTQNRNYALCEEFIKLVETHYKEHRDLQFYANKLSLTAKYISTAVKHSSGYSATQWIERYVTLDAITLLTSTNLSIKEIAYSLNFPSQSCFGKYFARVTGISPHNYRNKHRV